MIEIVIATRNKGKLAEIREILKELPFQIMGLDEAGDFPEVKEDGKSFLENSLIKARFIAKACKRFTMADDSGLEVACLGGKPGIHSARFAGTGATDEKNNKKLLEELQGIPDEKRKAAFRCVLVLASSSGRWVATVGTCPGEITTAPRGTHGFGYDPIFFVPSLNKTMAEIPLEIKNQISHRARALERIKSVLQDFVSFEKSCRQGLFVIEGHN